MKGQIEMESVSTEKPFKIDYDSSINIPFPIQNLIGQTFFVLPINPSLSKKDYNGFYSDPDGQKHYLAENKYSGTPKEKLVGKKLEIIGCKITNQGNLLHEKTFLELKRKDNGDVIYWNDDQYSHEVMTIGYFEKLKKDLINKKCNLSESFFYSYNIIKHKEIQ